MGNVIHVESICGFLIEKRETRDCWRCIHIENDNGVTPQLVCASCKWFDGTGDAGPDDNYVERPDGRWKG